MFIDGIHSDEGGGNGDTGQTTGMHDGSSQILQSSGTNIIGGVQLQ